MLVFVEGEKPEKNPQSKNDNQQHSTQPTYDTRSGNRTPVTSVGSECSHHCTMIPAPLTACNSTTLKLQLNLFNTDNKGMGNATILQRCPYYRGVCKEEVRLYHIILIKCPQHLFYAWPGGQWLLFIIFDKYCILYTVFFHYNYVQLLHQVVEGIMYKSTLETQPLFETWCLIMNIMVLGKKCQEKNLIKTGVKPMEDVGLHTSQYSITSLLTRWEALRPSYGDRGRPYKNVGLPLFMSC